MRLATEQREATDERPPSAPRPARLGGTDIFRGALVILTAVVIGGFVISRGIADPADTDAGEAETSEVDPASAGTNAGGDAEGEAATGDDSGATGSADTDTDTDTDAGTGGQTGDEVLPGDSTTETSTGLGGATTDGTTDGTTSTDDTMAETTTTTVISGPRPAAEVRVLVLNGAGTQGIAAMGTEAVETAGYTTAFPKNADSLRPSAILYVDGYQFDAEAVAAVFAAGLETLVAPLDDTNRPIDDIQGAHVIVVVGNDGAIPIS
jgi:hypothetical protein